MPRMAAAADVADAVIVFLVAPFAVQCPSPGGGLIGGGEIGIGN